MTEFERAVEINENDSDAMVHENVIDFLAGSKTMTVSFSQKRFVNKIRQLAIERPDECEIIIDAGDYITAHIPTNWLKIRPKRIMSEEEAAQRAEHMKNIRRKKGHHNINGEK